MSGMIAACPKCREYKWFYNPPLLNWKDKSKDEEYCLFHSPVENKIEISNFNFQLKLYIKQLREK